MKVIRYGDVYNTIENEDGEMEEVLIRGDYTMPIILNPYKIESIEPYISINCKQFKNVSIITYDSGKQFKVVGNYKALNEYKSSNQRTVIGYGR